MVNTITKEEIANLETASYQGRIIVIQTETEAEKAVSYLQKYNLIGFDTETKPSFKKGMIRKIALMQLAVEDTCFLFRLNLIGIPDGLKEILINNDIQKVGLSLKDDFAAIRRRIQLEPKNFVELQSFVRKFGIEDSGLQRIYAILFGQRISKGQRLSNWESEILTEAQQKYAALDAWACLRIYNKLIKLDFSGDDLHGEIDK